MARIEIEVKHVVCRCCFEAEVPPFNIEVNICTLGVPLSVLIESLNRMDKLLCDRCREIMTAVNEIGRDLDERDDKEADIDQKEARDPLGQGA